VETPQLKAARCVRTVHRQGRGALDALEALFAGLELLERALFLRITAAGRRTAPTAENKAEG